MGRYSGDLPEALSVGAQSPSRSPRDSTGHRYRWLPGESRASRR